MSASTAVHSNAFNFRSYLEHGVDPRTGQYTVSLAIPEVKSHALAGPALQLSIAFSPLNTRDAGFGLGWGINLSEYAPQANRLSLGTGETYRVSGTGDTPDIPERKVPSFHFHKQTDDTYRVVHKSGMVEILKVFGGSTPLALPTEILGPDGRGLQLGYVTFQGGERLSTVSDGTNELLRVQRNDATSQVVLEFYPGQGTDGEPLATFELHLDAGGRVSKVLLPTVEQACWRFAYETIRGTPVLSDVWSPTGAHEIMEHRDGGHAFPGDAHPPLPRVTRHVVSPGAGQPPIEVHYEYGNSNFLGYGELMSWVDDGYDNLYKVADAAFSYDSTAILWAEGIAQRSVQRVYNRFHLMTKEITTQGKCRKTVTHTYYADLPENRLKRFADQPAQCQLPWSVETCWELTDDATKRRSELSRTEYDEHGNLTMQINTDGTREEFAYFPIDGEPGLCPPDPERFMRSLRSRTAYPAESSYGTAPVLRTDFEYISLPPIAGPFSRPYLAEHQQTLSEVDAAELKRLRIEYFDDASDALLLGRKRSMSETLNDLTTFTDYEYLAVAGARLGESLLEVTETSKGYDGTQQTVMQRQSTLSGKTVMTRGLDGVEVHYAHDKLGRVISETVAPETEYEAARTYEYHLLGEHDQGAAWQLMTDVRKVQTRTTLDGLSRPVLEERQDVDAALAAGVTPTAAVFRPTYAALYDVLGQRSQETSFDWLRDDLLTLTTKYEYDDWGERKRTERPDGVVEVTEVSPFGLNGPVEHRWLETKATPPEICDRRVSHFNRFGKIDTVQHLDDDGRAVLTVEKRYDGLGQAVESSERSDIPERTTRHTFDVWRRIASAALPDGTTLHYSFAPHSTEALPTCIRVDPVNTTLPEVIAGTQKFDGLDRVMERTIGGRTETFEYDGGSLSPKTRTLPSGTQITIDYVRPLGDAPQSITAQGKADSYHYDLYSGMLTGADNGQGKRHYEYALTGKLALERWTTSAGDEHSSTHTLSRQGRPLERTDSGPGASGYTATTTHQYDAQGRIKCTTQGVVQVEMTYDSFGRPWKTTTRNTLTGQILLTTQTYDTFNREASRTLNVSGQLFSVTHCWRADSQLKSRHLETDGRCLLHEEFFYDRRNRLQRHICTGEQQPQDRFGNAVAQQVFTYDAMDNLSRCLTMFADGRRDIADYFYADEDACQLKEIKHQQHPDYPTVESLDYDDDGNLLSDPQGRDLRYDALGRLIGIVAAGRQETYHYDGHGELAGTVEADGTEVLRFYQGFQLHHEVRGDKALHVVYANDTPVAQHSPIDGHTRLLLTTAIGSVIAATREDAVTTAAYTAYGECGDELATLLGFNGEARERSDWYLLGRGYRAFYPALMRFNRPDSESPFGTGGLNPYIYCEGNPVTFRDRSGHRRELPEYIYRPEPVEEPKPAPVVSSGGGGGGWMAWLGVAISAVFLVASIVAAPWSLGLGAPLLTSAITGIAMQAAGVGLAVVGTLTSDPTLQIVTMIGSMGLGIYGGMVTAKANAAASSLAKQQKLSPASLFGGAFDDGGGFNIPRAHQVGSKGGQGLGSKATRAVDIPSETMQAQPWSAGTRAPAPQNLIQRMRVPAKIGPLKIRRYADTFPGPSVGQSTFWMRSASPPSPVLYGFTRYS